MVLCSARVGGLVSTGEGSGSVVAYYIYKAVQFVVLLALTAAVVFSVRDTLRAAVSPDRCDREGMPLGQNLVALMFFIVVLLVASTIFAMVNKYLGS